MPEKIDQSFIFDSETAKAQELEIFTFQESEMIKNNASEEEISKVREIIEKIKEGTIKN